MSSLQTQTTTELIDDSTDHEFDGLPGIDSLPDADVVIFDGKCKFCQKQVRRLHWFAKGRLTFVSLHDPRVIERFPDLSYEQMMHQMYVVTVDGERLGGAAAIKYLSRKCPRLWFAAPLMHIPFSLRFWQFAYLRVANVRYRISGTEDCDDGSCQIHLK